MTQTRDPVEPASDTVEREPDGGVLRRWLALVALLGATFIGTINNSIVNVAVPSMSTDLGVPISTTVWVISGFVIALGTLMPLAGKIGDMYGPRRVFLWGLLLFAVASLIVGSGSNIVVVIVGRLLQGAAGAPVLPCVLATISRLFDPHERGRAVGAWAAVNSAALAAGPGIGGVILDNLGWRAIFYMTSPSILVVAGAVAMLVPKDLPSVPRRLDVVGALLVAVALASFAIPITEGRTWGWTNPLTLALLIVCALTGVVLVRHLRRESEPFIDPALLRVSGYLAVTGIASLQMIVLFSVTFSVPVFLVVTGQASAAMAGLITSALPGSMVVGALVAGRLSGVVGFDHLASLGGIGMLVGAVGVALSVPSWPPLVASMLILGLGISLIQAPAANAVTGLAPPGQTGLAVGVFNTARFVLGGLGATLAAVVFTTISGTDTGPVGLEEGLRAVRVAMVVAVVPSFGVLLVARALAQVEDLASDA
ncbi:MAG: MFS transporter [Acidimicrobiales bacterium]